MEFKTISNQHISFELLKSFAIVSTNDGMSAIIGTTNTSFLLESKYMLDSMNSYNLVMEYINAPTGMPTAELCDKGNMNEIYCAADMLDQQTLIIDPLYTAEFSIQPVEPKINSVTWPTKRSPIDKLPLIAIVSTYGACEVRKKIDDMHKQWNKVVVDINKLWKDFCKIKYNSNSLKNFQDVKKYVDENHITACCWSDHNPDTNSWKLFCSNAIGTIITCNVTLNSAEIISVTNTNTGKVCYMKYFSYSNEGSTKSILIVSNIEGIIKLYHVNDENHCIEVPTLWSKNDKIRCQSSEIYYCPLKKQIFIVTTKGAHILAFVLSTDDKIIAKTTHFVGNISITGLQTLKPFEYIVCTLSGYTEHLKLHADDNILRITGTTIKNDIEVENYQILGMTSTINRAGWIFALYPCRIFDSYLKKPTLLSICTLNISDPLDILLSNKSRSMCEVFDCAEVIRCMFIKNLAPEKYIQFSADPVHLNTDFCYKLKIRLVIAIGKVVQNRRKSRYKEAVKNESDVNNIRTTITAIFAYTTLSRLIKLKNLSKFQHLSGKYMRKYLLDFMNAELGEHETHIQRIFMPVFDKMYEETEEIGKNYIEKCQYCDNDVDIATQYCKENHEMQRCCITFLQVPLFTRRQCTQCKSLAMDDEKQLREILFDDEIKCQFCDFPLIIDAEDDV